MEISSIKIFRPLNCRIQKTLDVVMFRKSKHLHFLQIMYTLNSRHLISPEEAKRISCSNVTDKINSGFAFLRTNKSKGDVEGRGWALKTRKQKVACHSRILRFSIIINGKTFY